MFGTSSIKGFATMLIVSILVSFLTAVYGTRVVVRFMGQQWLFNKTKKLVWCKKEQIQDIASKKEVRTNYL